MIEHRYSKDEKERALQAASAGLDMEMTSQAYSKHLKALIEEGKLSEAQLDNMVRNILRIKLRAGLSDNPYFKDKEKFKLLTSENLNLAKEAAIKSCVLLKNDQHILPLSAQKKIAIVCPLAHASKEQLDTWFFDGDKKDFQTSLMAFT